MNITDYTQKLVKAETEDDRMKLATDHMAEVEVESNGEDLEALQLKLDAEKLRADDLEKTLKEEKQNFQDRFFSKQPDQQKDDKKKVEKDEPKATLNQLGLGVRGY
jgi:hypothetical protein